MIIGNSLQKLQISYETGLPGVFNDLDRVIVLFNPNTLHFKYAADWNVTNTSGQVASRERHVFDFKSTRPVELSFQLFLDISREEETTLSNLPDPLKMSFRLNRFAGRMEKLTRLIQVSPELHRPPHCKLIWGSNILLHGVLTSLDQNLTAFAPEGSAVRAELSCSFTAVDSSRELHSADVAKQWVVRQGDSLPSIAREKYGDASLWRAIARENRISHPLQLTPGTRLLIPPLK